MLSLNDLQWTNCVLVESKKRSVSYFSQRNDTDTVVSLLDAEKNRIENWKKMSPKRVTLYDNYYDISEDNF